MTQKIEVKSCAKSSKIINTKQKCIKIVVAESDVPGIEAGQEIYLSEKPAREWARSMKILRNVRGGSRKKISRGEDRFHINRSANVERAVQPIKEAIKSEKERSSVISRRKYPIARGTNGESGK